MTGSRTAADASSIPREPRVLLIGGIPRPIGGVTQHVWRLASYYAHLGVEVLDLYPSRDKYPLPDVRVHVAPYNRLHRAAWFAWKVARSPAKNIHLHFSTVRRIAMLNPMIRIGGWRRKYILTLHHGDLAAGWKELSNRQRNRTIGTLRSFHRVVALSDRQQEFYETVIGIASESLCRGTSYVPLTPRLMEHLQAIGKGSQPNSGLPDQKILVASGYAERIYQHERCIDLLDELRGAFPVHLKLCLYGNPESPEYLEQLLKRCDRPDVSVENNLDFPEFMRELSHASLYLRPTTTDSFGLAVADAINAQVPVVASNVCLRFPGAFLCDPQQPAEFYSICRKVLAGDTDQLQRSDTTLPMFGDDFYD